jgi:hypothetical protein
MSTVADNCCNCGGCVTGPCTLPAGTFCCDTGVYGNIASAMVVVPGFRPSDWFPGTSDQTDSNMPDGYSEGTDQEYYAPTITYRTVTVRWTGFSAYTDSTHNTPAWIQAAYTIHPDIGDVCQIEVTDSSGNGFLTTLNDDGTISTSGTTGDMSCIVPLVSVDTGAFNSYASGSRAGTVLDDQGAYPAPGVFARYNWSGSGDAYFDANTYLTFTLSNPFTISSVVANTSPLTGSVISLVDSVPLTGSSVAVTNEDGSAAVLDLDELFCIGGSIVPADPTPNLIYAFKSRGGPGGTIQTVLANGWFPTTLSSPKMLPVFYYDLVTNPASSAIRYSPGSAAWPLNNIFPDWDGDYTNPGCPAAEFAFMTAAAESQITNPASQINTGCLGTSVGMYVQAANILFAARTIELGFYSSGMCYCVSQMCFTPFQGLDWLNNVTETVNDYNMLVPGAYGSAGTTTYLLLVPGVTNSPYECINPGSLMPNDCPCTGGITIKKAENLPLFATLEISNCGCDRLHCGPDCQLSDSTGFGCVAITSGS